MERVTFWNHYSTVTHESSGLFVKIFHSPIVSMVMIIEQEPRVPFPVEAVYLFIFKVRLLGILRTIIVHGIDESLQLEDALWIN